MSNLAGKKLAGYLEDIINETGQRNVWPISMEKGKLTVELQQTDVEMYQAILARAVTYTASILGKGMVIKEMEYVNKKTNSNILNFVQTLNLDKLYTDILA